MPVRLFAPILGVDPDRVKLAHLHAAISGRFDRDDTEHKAVDKPYSISPLTYDEASRSIGLELAIFSDEAIQRFAVSAARNPRVSLGRQEGRLGICEVIRAETWTELANHRDHSDWRLDVETPMVFRQGNRATPLPHPASILRSLDRTWRSWSDVPLPGPGVEAAYAAVWVTGIELSTHTVRVPGRSQGPGGRVDLTVNGATGWLALRCDDQEVSATVGPLMELAAYTGLGSMTRKGLGVTRVHPSRRGRRAGGDRGGRTR